MRAPTRVIVLRFAGTAAPVRAAVWRRELEVKFQSELDVARELRGLNQTETGSDSAGRRVEDALGGSPAALGNGGADFMMGLPEFIELGQNVGTRGLRYSSYGAFFQDDWHVNEHLTLNLGLRYQLHTPQYEVANRATNYGLGY